MTQAQTTRALARYIAGNRKEEIPAEIYEHAKVALVDWVAVTLAGKDEPLVSKLLAFTDFLGGNEQATILGRGLQRSVSHAALVNGAASHALDYDDTLKPFVGHPSVTLFPGLLAWAEWQGKSGADLLQAYLVGIEVGARIGTCAGPEHYPAGWHGTSTIGRLASAAACSKLMGLDEQQTLYALGIAGTQSCGLKRVFGTMCKPLHAGTASQGGLMAAILAADSFDSAEDILEGPNGFFQAFRGGHNEEAIASLGKTWAIEGLAQKYHASCHFTHSPIEAVLEIARGENLAPAQIRSVAVGVSRIALDTAGIPEPTTGLEGKFSLRYCIANALVRGDTGLGAFTDEMVREPEVRAFMDKVTVTPDPEIPETTWLAQAAVETETGQVYRTSVDVGTKTEDLATRREKIEAKFQDLCTPILGPKKVKNLAETLFSLERMGDVGELVASIL